MPREYPLHTIIGFILVVFILPTAMYYGLFLLVRFSSRPGPTPAVEPLPERMSFFHPKSELVAEVALIGIVGLALLMLIVMGLVHALRARSGGLWILLTLPLALWLLADGLTWRLRAARAKSRMPALEVDRLGVTYKKKRVPWHCVRDVSVVRVKSDYLIIRYVEDPLSVALKKKRLAILLSRISDRAFCAQVIRYWKSASTDDGASTG